MTKLPEESAREIRAVGSCLAFYPLDYFHQVSLFAICQSGIDFTPCVFEPIKPEIDCSLPLSFMGFNQPQEVLRHFLKLQAKEADSAISFMRFTHERLMTPLQIYFNLSLSDELTDRSNLELFIIAYLAKNNHLIENLPERDRDKMFAILTPALFSLLSCFSFHRFQSLRSFYLEGIQRPEAIKAISIIQEFKSKYRRPFVDRVRLERIEKLTRETHTRFYSDPSVTSKI